MDPKFEYWDELVARLTSERDEARAEVERLRAQVLAGYSRGTLDSDPPGHWLYTEVFIRETAGMRAEVERLHDVLFEQTAARGAWQARAERAEAEVERLCPFDRVDCAEGRRLLRARAERAEAERDALYAKLNAVDESENAELKEARGLLARAAVVSRRGAKCCHACASLDEDDVRAFLSRTGGES